MHSRRSCSEDKQRATAAAAAAAASSSSSVPHRNVRMARMGNIGHASVKEDKRPEAIFIQDDTLADSDDFPIL